MCAEQLPLFLYDPFTLRIKVSDALHFLWEYHYKDLASAPKYKAHFVRLSEYFLDKFLDEITDDDIRNMRRYFQSLGLKDSTINKPHTVMVLLFNRFQEWSDDNRVLDGLQIAKIALPRRNPASKVPKVRDANFARKTVISPDEYKSIRYYADDELTDLLDMLIWTRLRQCDLSRLTSENVNWATGRLEGIQNKTVTQSNPSGISYRVPLSRKMEVLVRRRMATTRPGTPLFRFRNFRKKWESARLSSGLPWVQIRDFRRSAATYLLKSGETLRTVSEGLGHTSTKTTEMYTPVNDRDLKSSTEKLSSTF